MADILIRGMEMPKDGHVIVRVYANGDVCEPTPCPGVWEKVARANPLPEGHGRLIDGGAVVKTICNSCDGQCEAVQCDCLNCKADCRCDIVKEISDAHTIVPAEGGGENG